uniref:Uncharacterized protein n=1 Tax=Gossypium raimondii TaxID=29730 RepID=A0A0D2QTJ6_GOSRA|nr:hypothetical protein B456_007G160900 [Gossypium raimondii]
MSFERNFHLQFIHVRRQYIFLQNFRSFLCVFGTIYKGLKIVLFGVLLVFGGIKVSSMSILLSMGTNPLCLAIALNSCWLLRVSLLMMFMECKILATLRNVHGCHNGDIYVIFLGIVRIMSCRCISNFHFEIDTHCQLTMRESTLVAIHARAWMYTSVLSVVVI